MHKTGLWRDPWGGVLTYIECNILRNIHKEEERTSTARSILTEVCLATWHPFYVNADE